MNTDKTPQILDELAELEWAVMAATFAYNERFGLGVPPEALESEELKALDAAEDAYMEARRNLNV